jgi:serine/threonine protein kinase
VVIHVIEFQNHNLSINFLTNEADQLTKAQHENIVQYKDHFVEDKLFYFITEFIE